MYLSHQSIPLIQSILPMNGIFIHGNLEIFPQSCRKSLFKMVLSIHLWLLPIRKNFCNSFRSTENRIHQEIYWSFANRLYGHRERCTSQFHLKSHLNRSRPRCSFISCRKSPICRNSLSIFKNGRYCDHFPGKTQLQKGDRVYLIY